MLDPEQPRDENGRFATSAEAGGGVWTEPVFGKNKKANVALALKTITDAGFVAKEYSSKSPSAAVYSNGAVHINSAHKFWSDPIAFQHGAAVSGHLSSNSPSHVLHHEIGHAIYDAPDNFMTLVHQDIARSEVSKYAARNPKEFVSEVHAGMQAGKQYSDNVMKPFAEYARKRMGVS